MGCGGIGVVYMVIGANFCDVSGQGDLVCEGGLFRYGGFGKA